MSQFVQFEGRVEPMEWGKSIYTILRLPTEVVAALGKTRRVAGEINDDSFNLALTRAPVCPDVFLWVGQSLLGLAGLVPGEWVEVRLRPAPDDVVDTADDVMAALRAGDVTQEWSTLTPGKQRAHLYQIDGAKTLPTRTKRINALIASLKGHA